MPSCFSELLINGFSHLAVSQNHPGALKTQSSEIQPWQQRLITVEAGKFVFLRSSLSNCEVQLALRITAGCINWALGL
jgi:hypothetical protein